MLQSFFGIPSIYINIIIYSQCMCMSVYVHREKEKRGGVDRSILCTKASHPQVWSFLCVRLHSSTCPFPFSLVQKPVGLQFILISPSWAPLCIFLLDSTKLRWSWSPHSVLFLDKCSNGGCQIAWLASDFPSPEYTDLKLPLPSSPPSSSAVQSNAI